MHFLLETPEHLFFLLFVPHLIFKQWAFSLKRATLNPADFLGQLEVHLQCQTHQQETSKHFRACGRVKVMISSNRLASRSKHHQISLIKEALQASLDHHQLWANQLSGPFLASKAVSQTLDSKTPLPQDFSLGRHQPSEFSQEALLIPKHNSQVMLEHRASEILE